MTFTTALISFGFLTLMMVGIEIMFTYATQGFGYGFSANRGEVIRSPLAIRIQRAYQNQVESTAYIVPILAAAAIVDLQGADVQMAAMLAVVGRVAFAVLYYTGVPFVRVPAFVMGTLSVFYIAFRLLGLAF